VKIHSLNRPYLHIFAHSDEVEETGVINLNGVNVESDPHKETLLGVSVFLIIQNIHFLSNQLQKPFSFTLFTSSNSHALAASSTKDLQSWISKLDPTRLPS
jgi:kinesin family protein 1